jgi:uncharacterized phage protein (TIGR02218 family)
MRNISSELASHFASSCTTLATCWKLTRKDNMVMGFTDHDQDIVFETILYASISGFNPTAIENKADMSVDNLELDGQFLETGIKETDLLAGLYDNAKIEVFIVNYKDLSMGKLTAKRGILGEVTMNGQYFHAEMRGLMQYLSQTIGQIYTPSCSARLGDNRCKVTLSPFTVSASVTQMIDRQTFIATALTQTAGYFTAGEVIWRSGSNNNRRMEVKDFALQKVTLVLPMGSDIAIGDSFDIIAGCDKTASICSGRFNNIINFRGFPDIPGTDKMFTTAGTMTKASRL